MMTMKFTMLCRTRGVALLACMFLLLLSGSSTIVSANDEDDVLDTDRPPMKFDMSSQVLQSGYKIAELMEFDGVANFQVQGLSMEAQANVTAGVTMEVMDRTDNGSNQGGQKIVATITDFAFDIDAITVSLQCDSNNRQGTDDPDCEEVYGLVGFEEVLLFDKNGELEEVDGPGGIELVSREDMKAMTATIAGGASRVDAHSQLMSILPDHEIKPGDNWEDDFDFGMFGSFTGQASLLGYQTIKGSDCAVFSLEGDFHLDISTMYTLMMMDSQDIQDLPDTLDAHLKLTLHWDFSHKITRQSELKITTAIDTTSPFDEYSKMHVPIDMTLKTELDILEFPPSQEEGDDVNSIKESAGDSYVAAPPQVAPSAPASNDGKKIGWALLGLMIVVTISVGSVLHWKKRSVVGSSNEELEFTAVAQEDAAML